MPGTLLYFKSTDCTCWSHLENTFTATPGLVFDELTGYLSWAKVTHDICCGKSPVHWTHRTHLIQVFICKNIPFCVVASYLSISCMHCDSRSASFCIDGCIKGYASRILTFRILDSKFRVRVAWPIWLTPWVGEPEEVWTRKDPLIKSSVDPLPVQLL